MKITLWKPVPLIAIACVISAAPALAADYHHMHLTAPDPVAGAEWYAKHFDGDLIQPDRCMIGNIAFLFFKKSGEFPGSVGSGVDHIGFSVEDIDATMKAFEEGGVKILSGVQELPGLKIAFVEDPWGTKIEIVQDPDLLGFHHIHLHSTDVDATISWYQEAFGGEHFESFKGLPIKGVDYGDVLVMVQPAGEEKAPTKGRSIDHLGFSTPDLDGAAEALKAKGVNFSLNPVPFGKLRISFIDGPDGVRIEYVQPASE